jgi:hypothetical protein
MLFKMGFPSSLDAVMAMFTITYSLPPPIGIGLAGGIWVAVKVTESGPSGGRL